MQIRQTGSWEACPDPAITERYVAGHFCKAEADTNANPKRWHHEIEATLVSSTELC